MSGTHDHPEITRDPSRGDPELKAQLAALERDSGVEPAAFATVAAVVATLLRADAEAGREDA